MSKLGGHENMWPASVILPTPQDGDVVLEATGVRYGTYNDECAFFEWLDKIECVRSSVGRLRTLYITVDSNAVDDDALRELVALFERYDVDVAQLRVFDTERIGDWFRDSQ